MPLSTMYHLRNFDPRTADPAALRVAVRIPNALQLQPGGVNLAVAYRREGEDANKREEKFLLEELPAEVAYLTAEQRPGTHLHASHRADRRAAHARATDRHLRRRNEAAEIMARSESAPTLAIAAGGQTDQSI